MGHNLSHLLLVSAAYVIAAGSPGPSTMRIMGTAMHQGRQAALALAAGVVTGSVFWGVMAATGGSALLASYAQALVVLKILGGCYLLFLAFKAARGALTPDKPDSATTMANRPVAGLFTCRWRGSWSAIAVDSRLID